MIADPANKKGAGEGLGESADFQGDPYASSIATNWRPAHRVDKMLTFDGLILHKSIVVVLIHLAPKNCFVYIWCATHSGSATLDWPHMQLLLTSAGNFPAHLINWWNEHTISLY